LDNALPSFKGEAALENLPVLPARVLAPLPAFADAALGLGHVTALRSPDGTLRYDLPGLPLDGEAYPSLALRAAVAGSGIDWRSVQMEFGHAVKAGGAGELNAPLDGLSRQWINYYGKAGRFPSVRFADLVAGRLGATLLKDRIIVVGATALGTGDNIPTPFDASLPGVERLATSIDNLMTQRVLARPVWGSALELLLMLGLPLLAVALIGSWPLRRAMALLALLTVLLGIGMQWRFETANEFFAPAFPVLALLLATLGAIALRAGVEQRRRVVALAALASSEERYALAAQGANDGLWDWDIEGKQIHFSARWLALMGLDAAEAGGIDAWKRPLGGAQREAFDAALREHLEGRSLQFSHVLEFSQGGQPRWLLARGMATRVKGKPVRMAGSLTDVSELHRLQQQLSHDALHDRLTGLPNRTLFRAQLEQLLANSGPGTVGMLLVGLDDFRAFNETHGVVVGDRALAEVARRLRSREGVAVPVARIGPDQFALAAPSKAGELELVNWARKLFEPDFHLGGEALRLQAGMGWAHTSEGTAGGDELIGAAEAALARAKSQGPGQWHRYDAAEQLVEQSRRWMIEQIDKALAAGNQFQLHYQPFVRLHDRALLGFEALIRWQHPSRGLVMPGDFIPVAEASGQIAALGRWTLLTAAAQLRQWHLLGFTGEIAVNVSGVQLERDIELLADAHAVLGALGSAPPHQLKLEVTESMAMANPQRSAELLQELARMGFKISIDDFGTGYSSLAYLHRFPFDTLKIDRSFVMRLAAGREAVEIVRTIVGLAHALGKQTLAEGVEDEAQALLLEDLGVQVAQGWLFAKALPAAQAEGLIGKTPWVRPIQASR
ncbi:MAG TPA: EAL domain-containing protein, partial [Burkholderiaceae bacterium]